MNKLLVFLSLLAITAVPAFAATRTITLTVPTMTCSACPITVRKALTRIDGVVEAKVTWKPKEAMVTYDDAKTNVQTLLDATKNAGYPATVKGAGK